jgi:glycine/D-amino acid oxidase-like deaminating enzyme
MSSRVEAVVVGAGAVGLAIARRLAASGMEPLVLDGEPGFGMGTSSRNSEVIHAGLYYPPGSLKATLCVSGRHLLYRYCEENGVPHRRLGKLVIAAAPEQVPALHAIAATAVAAGVTDLQGDRRGRGRAPRAGRLGATGRSCRRRPGSSTRTPSCCGSWARSRRGPDRSSPGPGSRACRAGRTAGGSTSRARPSPW